MNHQYYHQVVSSHGHQEDLTRPRTQVPLRWWAAPRGVPRVRAGARAAEFVHLLRSFGCHGSALGGWQKQRWCYASWGVDKCVEKCVENNLLVLHLVFPLDIHIYIYHYMMYARMNNQMFTCEQYRAQRSEFFLCHLPVLLDCYSKWVIIQIQMKVLNYQQIYPTITRMSCQVSINNNYHCSITSKIWYLLSDIRHS